MVVADEPTELFSYLSGGVYGDEEENFAFIGRERETLKHESKWFRKKLQLKKER